jgi:hypothetical protein
VFRLHPIKELVIPYTYIKSIVLNTRHNNIVGNLTLLNDKVLPIPFGNIDCNSVEVVELIEKYIEIK